MPGVLSLTAVGDGEVVGAEAVLHLGQGEDGVCQEMELGTPGWGVGHDTHGR